MDSNLLSCSKCGHTVSETAEACAYCGAVVSSGDSSSQSAEGTPETTAPTTAAPASSGEDSPPVLEMAAESSGPSEEAEIKSEAVTPTQSQPEETLPEGNEPAAEAAAVTDAQPAPADDQIDFQLPDEELIVEIDSEETAKGSELSGADAKTAEIKPPVSKVDSSLDGADIVQLEQRAAGETADVIPLADKVSAKDGLEDSSGLPETPVLEVGGEDPSESETLGADILELVEDEAAGT